MMFMESLPQHRYGSVQLKARHRFWTEGIEEVHVPTLCHPSTYPAALLMSRVRNPEAGGKSHWPFGCLFKQRLGGRA